MRSELQVEIDMLRDQLLDAKEALREANERVLDAVREAHERLLDMGYLRGEDKAINDQLRTENARLARLVVSLGGVV